MTPEQRTAVYAVVPVLAAVLVTFGLISDEEAAVLSAAVVSTIGVIVAFLHRPTRG